MRRMGNDETKRRDDDHKYCIRTWYDNYENRTLISALFVLLMLPLRRTAKRLMSWTEALRLPGLRPSLVLVTTDNSLAILAVTDWFFSAVSVKLSTFKRIIRFCRSRIVSSYASICILYYSAEYYCSMGHTIGPNKNVNSRWQQRGL